MKHFELVKDKDTLHIVSIDLGRMPWEKVMVALDYYDSYFAGKGINAVCIRSFNGNSVSCIALNNPDVMPVIELPVGIMAIASRSKYVSKILGNIEKFGLKDVLLLGIHEDGGIALSVGDPQTGDPIEEEGNLVKFAKSEFAVLGWDKPDEDGDTMQMRICDDILEMIRTFSKQGHSGHSANYSINLLDRLLRFKPIAPLTGKDDEWTEVGMAHGGSRPVFQNKRDSEVFKENGEAYWAFGKVFEDENGGRFTNKDSRVPITFPWVHPKSPEVVKRESPVAEVKEQYAEVSEKPSVEVKEQYAEVSEKPSVEVKDAEDCCACQEEPECACCDPDDVPEKPE